MIPRRSAALVAAAGLVVLSSNARADGDVLIPPEPAPAPGLVWCVSPTGNDWETRERCRYIGGLWLGWQEDNLREMPSLGDSSPNDKGHVAAAASANAGRIRKAQEKLRAIGVYDGEIDGIADPKTIEAVRSFQRRIGRKPTGKIDDPLEKAMDEVLRLAGTPAQDQEGGAAISKAAKPKLQRPRQHSTPPRTSAGSDVASQLAAKIKASNLSDQQRMIIEVASVLGTGEFCLGKGVDYRELAETMIAGWRSNSLSDDLLTQMSIDFGLQIGHEGRVYSFREGTVIDLATIPDPKSGCNEIYRQVAQVSQENENPPPAAAPAPPDQGLAQGEEISASNPSQPPRTMVPDAARPAGPLEIAQGEQSSATGRPFGEAQGSGADRLPDETLAALLRRGDELLAVGDLSAARLLYERAAMGGSARAATAAGKTYDPIFLKDTAVLGPPPEAVKALEWYRRAIELGDTEAVARLKQLQAFAGQ